MYKSMCSPWLHTMAMVIQLSVEMFTVTNLIIIVKIWNSQRVAENKVIKIKIYHFN